MRSAVIGIGSNSVRMLVAEITGGRAVALLRDRAGTRLFAGLDEQGRLRMDAMVVTARTVAAMADRARALGAAEIMLFATSASRDAANGADFAGLLRDLSGLEVNICSGEEEAAFSFFGATGGGFSGVIDIGGGSTELVTGEGADVRTACSCQMGAVRLSRIKPINSQADLQDMIAIADGILTGKLAEAPIPILPARWFGTGGTFTSMAAIKKDIPWTERSHMHGTILTLPDVTAAAERLAGMTIEQRLQLPSMQPNRADIIVHGMAILIAVMQHLHIPELAVSEYGNLDGYMKHKYGLQGDILPATR